MARRRVPAATALVAAILALIAAQRAYAQTQDLSNSPLLPQKPCTSCERGTAQAGGGADAGAQSAPPAPPASQGLPAASAPAPAFHLNDVRFTGAQGLSAAELHAVAQPYIGRDVTMADLEKLSQAVTTLYRERGFFLAQAVVPVQTVTNGVVEISVIEGKLGNVTVIVAPDAPITEARARAFLAGLQPGMAVDARSYERALLLLSDQPGLRVNSTLEEGAQPGTTDLTVEVTAAPRWAFSVFGDNWGTLESGRYRLGGTARWMSPAGIGDNLDVRLMASDSHGTLLGRVSYEAPLGSSGLRAGVGVSRVDYELGGAFVDLHAHGIADVVDFSLDYPLIRSREQNLFVRLSGNEQDLHDEYDAIDFSSRKRIQGLGLGWGWERRDAMLGGGYWASTGTYYHGRLDILDPFSELADQGTFGRHTEGSFDKLTLQFSRLQSIIDRHSLYVSVGGQMASKNLDASQKLSLGGPQSVRAYPSGELLVDEGAIGTVEWRWSYNAEITPFVFYDAARGRIARDPSFFDTANTQSLRGAGIGLSWVRSGNFLINATLAWRDGTRPAVTDGGGRNPRLFVQLQKAI
jgi:hemolysin activation/secretion protein